MHTYERKKEDQCGTFRGSSSARKAEESPGEKVSLRPSKEKTEIGKGSLYDWGVALISRGRSLLGGEKKVTLISRAEGTSYPRKMELFIKGKNESVTRTPPFGDFFEIAGRKRGSGQLA